MIKKLSKNQIYIIVLALFVLLLLSINAVRFDYMIFFGNQYYKISNFDIAKSYYEKAVELNNSNKYKASNNLGNIQYEKGDYGDAINSYSIAAEECKDNCDEVLYNLGNSYYKKGQELNSIEEKKQFFELAVDLYEKSLTIKDDNQARENREFVMRQIELLDEQMNSEDSVAEEEGVEGEGTEGEGAEGEGTEKEESGEQGRGNEGEEGEGEGSKLDQETTQQVEQYMKQLQQIEKDAQQYHKRNNSKEKNSEINDMFQDFFGRPNPFANDPFFNRNLRQNVDGVDSNVKDW